MKELMTQFLIFPATFLRLKSHISINTYLYIITVHETDIWFRILSNDQSMHLSTVKETEVTGVNFI